jgi:hypothetical protein
MNKTTVTNMTVTAKAAMKAMTATAVSRAKTTMTNINDNVMTTATTGCMEVREVIILDYYSIPIVRNAGIENAVNAIIIWSTVKC